MIALGVNDQSTSIFRSAKATGIQSGENAISECMTGRETHDAMIEGCYGMYKLKGRKERAGLCRGAYHYRHDHDVK